MVPTKCLALCFLVENGCSKFYVETSDKIPFCSGFSSFAAQKLGLWSRSPSPVSFAAHILVQREPPSPRDVLCTWTLHSAVCQHHLDKNTPQHLRAKQTESKTEKKIFSALGKCPAHCNCILQEALCYSVEHFDIQRIICYSSSFSQLLNLKTS